MYSLNIGPLISLTFWRKVIGHEEMILLLISQLYLISDLGEFYFEYVVTTTIHQC